MRTLIVLAFISSFFLTSCENEPDASLENVTLSCFGFTENELISIGTNHNRYLTEVYAAVDFDSCVNCKEEIIAAFKSLDIDVSGLGVSLDSLIDIAAKTYNNLESIDIRTWTNPPFNQSTHNYLSAIMDELDYSSSHSEYVHRLDSLKILVKSDNSIDCFSEEIIIATIEVAKNSAYLWMPVHMGGVDYYSLYQQNSIEFRRRPWSWRNAFTSDVASVGASMIELAVLMAITSAVAPPGNLLIATGIAVNAAFGSAIGGFL